MIFILIIIHVSYHHVINNLYHYFHVHVNVNTLHHYYIIYYVNFMVNIIVNVMEIIKVDAYFLYRLIFILLYLYHLRILNFLILIADFFSNFYFILYHHFQIHNSIPYHFILFDFIIIHFNIIIHVIIMIHLLCWI